MRVLTVKQPWADLIMADVKDVENRTWPIPSTLTDRYRCGRCLQLKDDPDGCTCGYPFSARADGPFPFRLWIHAAKLPADTIDAWHAWDQHVGHGGTEPDHYGAVLGSVEATGCHHADNCATWDRGYCSRWSEAGGWHWTLTNPNPLAEPIPAKGRLGLWTPDHDLTVALDQAVPA